MRVAAIVLAAGRGERLRQGISKPLVSLGGKPLVIHSLMALARHRCIASIIVVVNRDNRHAIEGAIRTYRVPKIRDVVLGGSRRQDSVRRGLSAVDIHTDLVLIHDSARPFVDKDAVAAVIREAAARGAAITAVPVKATIKQAHSRSPWGPQVQVKKTLERSGLWEAQTPQVFQKGILLRAYDRYGNQDVTDDSALVERLGKPVGIILGSYRNIKITTPEDLFLARALARRPPRKIKK